MRFLLVLFAVLVLLTAGLFIYTVSFENQLEEKTEFVQLVVPNEFASLSGSVGSTVGKPAKMIINAPEAFMSGNSPDGARYVNKKYLDIQSIKPLLWSSLSYNFLIAKIGLLIAFFVSLASFIFLLKARRN